MFYRIKHPVGNLILKANNEIKLYNFIIFPLNMLPISVAQCVRALTTKLIVESSNINGAFINFTFLKTIKTYFIQLLSKLKILER